MEIMRAKRNKQVNWYFCREDGLSRRWSSFNIKLCRFISTTIYRDEFYDSQQFRIECKYWKMPGILIYP